MKFTLIFKVPISAGQLPVPLAASMDDEKDASGELEKYKGQAKKIMRQTSTTSPTPCTIEAGTYSFHYVIIDAPGTSGAKICFLTLAEKGCPRRLAFDYLDDLQKEFIQLHGQQIDNVERPYKFITFGKAWVWVVLELVLIAKLSDTFIQKTKKLYTDTRANRNHLKMMSDDLRDIQGIMTRNIQEVLGRGEKLESKRVRTVTGRSATLSAETRRFKDKATSFQKDGDRGYHRPCNLSVGEVEAVRLPFTRIALDCRRARKKESPQACDSLQRQKCLRTGIQKTLHTLARHEQNRRKGASAALKSWEGGSNNNHEDEDGVQSGWAVRSGAGGTMRED
eukprot:755772-Hanusia_phi.AAC.6